VLGRAMRLLYNCSACDDSSWRRWSLTIVVQANATVQCDTHSVTHHSSHTSEPPATSHQRILLSREAHYGDMAQSGDTFRPRSQNTTPPCRQARGYRGTYRTGHHGTDVLPQSQPDPGKGSVWQRSCCRRRKRASPPRRHRHCQTANSMHAGPAAPGAGDD
jgi:hypothetical protein